MTEGLDHEEKTVSVNRNDGLVLVAKQVCRDLRKRSTSAERLFWEEVRERRFIGLKFYRQHPIFVDLDGRETFFVADFYCHERKIVIELDGKVHDYSKNHDEARTAAINCRGISVVRFSNEEIEHDLEVVLARLGKILK